MLSTNTYNDDFNLNGYLSDNRSLNQNRALNLNRTLNQNRTLYQNRFINDTPPLLGDSSINLYCGSSLLFSKLRLYLISITPRFVYFSSITIPNQLL